MDITEIDFGQDAFADIIAKDVRYSARAYALLMEVIHTLGLEGRHMTGEQILEEFRELTLDQYGPLSFSVLREWGVTRCEDIGEMMMSLVESRRIHKDEEDSFESFAGGYDFDETFLGPFAT